MKVDINTSILTSLLTQNKSKAQDIIGKFPKLKKWEQSIDKPTFRDLVKLANFFKVPFGYFFLDEIPQKVYPIPHYRSINKGQFTPSQELLETIDILKERQDWAKDILKDFKEPLSFAKSITTNTNIADAVAKVREVLQLDENWALIYNIRTWEEAFRLLVKRCEDAGIFVVINGVVNHNPKRKLNVNEFRGFVLYDDIAPFIFINNKDFVSGKIFSIIHEVVHILIGQSASFDLKNLSPADNRVETFCDSVTAEFLVPQKILAELFDGVGADYDRLSRAFKVSRIVVARRLLDTNKIDKAEFLRAYNSFRVAASEKTQAGKGGNFYNTAPYRIGRSFFNLVYSSVKQNKMLYRDAFQLTGLKPKTFDGYVKKHIG